jgi:DNA repair protein RadA/Sms
MAKKKGTSTIFKCSSCGYTMPKWLGRCPECGEWNSFEEQTVQNSAASVPAPFSSVNSKPVPLSKVSALEDSRFHSGIKELDRVLGGGIMKRSAILVGGEPGIGKSTLLLQTAVAVANSNRAAGKVLYVSGEESASQIKNRADRLGLDTSNIELLCSTSLESIESALNAISPVCIIVDSIQTVCSPEAGVIPGSVSQLKYCANELVSWVKERDSVMFLVAHITKDGSIAGPKSLEHLVDTVLSFDRNEEDVRFLRAQKNRFGSVDELGIFEMSEKGLKPVDDPSGMFMIRRENGIPAGIAIVPVMEGTQVFMVEIQALTVPAKASVNRVYSDNIDSARVSRVAAVLEKKTKLKFSECDIYVNVAGGVRITESSVDAALAAALYSARTDLPLKDKMVIAGEISLAGEIRPVRGLKQRIKTATALGFKNFVAPGSEPGIIRVADVKDLVKQIFS